MMMARANLGVILAPMLPDRQYGLRSIRRIKAWHRGLEFVAQIYRATKLFPREELFGLTSQIRRAAVAIPSHIAEGVERDTVRERRRFLTVAKSSIAEIETQLEAAVLIGYLSEETLLELLQTTDELSRMLTQMKRHIRARPGT